MDMVNSSTRIDPEGPPPKDPQNGKALEPSPSFSWYREVVEEHALVEQLCSKAQEEGLQADQCLPTSAGSAGILSSSLAILSQAKIFRRSSWKLSTMLATRRPCILSLVGAPDLRE